MNIWTAIARRNPAPTPAETELLQSSLESARANQDLRFLRKQIPKWIALVAHSGGRLGLVFGIYAYGRGLQERGAWRGWRRVWMAVMLRAGLWQLERRFPGAPGWNDFYMTLWFVTGEGKYLDELYRRCTSRPWPAATPDVQNTYATARWMAFSVRKRLPDFDAAISLLEKEHGETVTLPNYDDFSPDFVPTVEPEYTAGPVGPITLFVGPGDWHVFDGNPGDVDCGICGRPYVDPIHIRPPDRPAA